MAGILEHVPESLVDRVRLIDLADETRSPGINLLDTRVFADRDRTADSVVRVARGLWEQWGPRMQSILEQTVKTLHEANEQMEADRQHTILDGLRLLSNEPFRNSVLAKVSDPYILEWWARDFGGWHRQYRAEALAPVQTRLSYYASSKRARAILGQPRSTIDLRETILEGGVLLVSTSQGTVGRDVAALVSTSLLNLVDSVIREQGGVAFSKRRGALVVVDEMQSMPGVDYESMLSELGKFGASFILATQSLAKLDDPVAHHAGHHPGQRGLPGGVPGGGQRRPAAGVGAGQGAGIRGRHRVPGRAPLLRPRHRGDRADARLLHDGAQAGGWRPRRCRANPHRRDRLHPAGPRPGRPDGGGGRGRKEGERVPAVAGGAAERRGAARGEPAMRPATLETGLLGLLAQAPFLDRQEMAAISCRSRGAVYEAVHRLEEGGLADSIPHAADLAPPARRYCLTAYGLRKLAEVNGGTPVSSTGQAVDDLLRLYPVSAQWRRILLDRLDAVAALYRLASTIAGAAHPIGLRLYRAAPLDAALLLPGGRTLGVVRQGPAADRTAFAKRLWRLGQGPLPGAVLVLTSDEVRLRHARGVLARTPLNALLALERDAALAGAGARVWRPASGNAILDLGYAVERLRPGGDLPEEGPLSQASLPGGLAADAAHALPALLKPAEKRALDLLADWPWLLQRDLAGLLGVSETRISRLVNPLAGFGLASRTPAADGRLALTDAGLALLARRDRASVGVARRRWSVNPVDAAKPMDWRNVSGGRSRQLLRNIEHTAAVHGFLSALARQSRALGWETAQLDPPHRASRHFRHDGTLRSVNPDAFGVLRRGPAAWAFFLEWERRAVRPATMTQRLAPYLRYYASHRPTDDHGTRPAVLVVFDGDIAATHFLALAEREMARAGAKVPLWVSHREAIDALGPMGRAWLTPGDWDPPSCRPRNKPPIQLRREGGNSSYPVPLPIGDERPCARNISTANEDPGGAGDGASSGSTRRPSGSA